MDSTHTESEQTQYRCTCNGQVTKNCPEHGAWSITPSHPPTLGVLDDVLAPPGKYGPEEVYIKLDQETALRLQEDHYYEPQRSLTIAHSSSKETKMRRGLWEKDDASRCIKLMRCRSLTAEKGLWNPKHPTGHVPFPIKPWKWYMTNGQGRAQAVLDTCEVDPSFSYVSRIVAVTVDTDKCIFDDYFYNGGDCLPSVSMIC